MARSSDEDNAKRSDSDMDRSKRVTNDGPNLTDTSNQEVGSNDTIPRRGVNLRLRSPLFQANYTQLLQDETMPSWLEVPCELPTDLFHTLTPITSSRFLGRNFIGQSTPYAQNLPNITSSTGRSEPTGGEDPEAVRAVQPVVLEPVTLDFSVETVHSEELFEHVVQSQPRPPLVGEAASVDGVVSTSVGTSVTRFSTAGDYSQPERDPLADKVQTLLQNLGDSDSVAVQTSLSYIRPLRRKVRAVRATPGTVTKRRPMKSVAVQTESTFVNLDETKTFASSFAVTDKISIASVAIQTSSTKTNPTQRREYKSNRTQTVTIPKEIRSISDEQFEYIQPQNKVHREPVDASTQHQTRVYESQSKQKSIRPESLPESEQKEAKAWFIPFDVKRSRRANNVSKQKDVHWFDMKGDDSDLFNFATVSLQDAFKQRCRHLMRKSQKRAQYIRSRTQVRKMTAERRLNTMLHIYEANRVREEVEKARTRRSVQRSVDDYEEPFRLRRIFTHKEMREQTERIYRQLPEVVEKAKLKKKAEEEKTNRLMAQIYTHRVKQNTLKGKTDFPITKHMVYV
ncbi:hypothetical protein HDE_13802 [Halotydeus destructor]|nr:hypothetical protein HDE_13802 [Halotydeus destructor]